VNFGRGWPDSPAAGKTLVSFRVVNLPAASLRSVAQDKKRDIVNFGRGWLGSPAAGKTVVSFRGVNLCATRSETNSLLRIPLGLCQKPPDGDMSGRKRSCLTTTRDESSSKARQTPLAA
jgi:hypothetical protein